MIWTIIDKNMATYKEQHGYTIQEDFEKFHNDNPGVYKEFENQVFQAKSKGKKKISSKTVIGFIRWEYFLRTESKDEFKINDAYTSRYARLYLSKHPQDQEIFNLRNLRSN